MGRHKQLISFILLLFLIFITPNLAENDACLNEKAKDLRENFIIEQQLSKLNQTAIGLEWLMNEFFESLTYVMVRIESMHFSINYMKEILSDPDKAEKYYYVENSIFEKFTNKNAWEDEPITARNEYFKIFIENIKKVVNDTKNFLAKYEHCGDFVNIFKKLNIQEYDIHQLEATINNTEKLRKKVIISSFLPNIGYKPVKNNDAAKFKQIISKLSDSKIENLALLELNDLMRKRKEMIIHMPFEYSNDDIKKLFASFERLLLKKDKHIIFTSTYLLSYFTSRPMLIHLFLKTNLTKFLIPLLEHTKEAIVNNVVEIFANVARFKEGVKDIINYEALKTLRQVFIQFNDDEIHFNAIMLLLRITNTGKFGVEAIIKQDKDLLYFIIRHLLKDENMFQRLPSLSALKNIMNEANELVTQEIIQFGTVCDLCKLFYYYKDESEIVIDTLETLLFILEKSGNHLEEVVNSSSSCGCYDFISQQNNHEDKTIRKKSEYIIKKYFAAQCIISLNNFWTFF